MVCAGGEAAGLNVFGLKSEIRRVGNLILTAIQEFRNEMSQGQQDLEQEIQAVRASEQALLQREAQNAARLQTIIDGLQGNVPANLQPQIDELKAIQAEMDAAAQAPAPTPAAAGGTPPA